MKFTDLKGREWEIRITHGTAMRIKADGANLYDLEADLGKKLRELAEDNFAMATWIWRIVKEQAIAKGVGEDDFYDSLGGVAMAKARLAFLESYADFTQNPAIHSSLKEQVEMDRRADLESQRATAKAIELARRHMDSLVGQISDENIEKLFFDLLKQTDEKSAEQKLSERSSA